MGYSLIKLPVAARTDGHQGAAMGRNYINERAFADPRERSAAKRQKNQATRKKKAAEAAFQAAHKERSKWCHAPGCSNLAVMGDDGWWPCCSEACMARWNDSLK